MAVINVVDILDGNTLVVSPTWQVNGATGQLVRIEGMAAPDLNTAEGQLALHRVSLLLIGCPVFVTRIYPPDGDVLPCELEYGGLPLWKHFFEFSTEVRNRSLELTEVSASQLPDIEIAW